MIDVVGPTERKACSFFPNVFNIDQNIARKLALDPQAPTLLVRRLVRARSAQRAVSIEANVVHQPERISRGLNQSIGKRITQMCEWSEAIVRVDGDHVRGLVESLAAIWRDARHP